MTLREQLEKKSEELNGEGYTGAWVHFIQDTGNDGLILKAAIRDIVDAVPHIFPLDLPEQVEKKGDVEVTAPMKLWFEAVAKLGGSSNEEIAGKICRSVPTVERRLRLIRDVWREEFSP